MQPSMKSRVTTVILHSAMLGMPVEAAKYCETMVGGKLLAKLATCFEENLLALTHALFTRPVRCIPIPN